MTLSLLANPLVLSCLFLLVLVLATMQRWFHWRRRYHHLKSLFRETEETRQDVQEKHRQLLEQAERDAAFSNDLSRAEMTTRFQHPRLQMHRTDAVVSIPERYRYARRLSEKGMDADQVSELLSLSPHEARQVVRLAKLTGES